MSDAMIQLNDLPLRPKKLSDTELEGVFGGCKASGKKCSSSKDCCNNKKCGTAEFGMNSSQFQHAWMNDVDGGWKVTTKRKVCGF